MESEKKIRKSLQKSQFVERVRVPGVLVGQKLDISRTSLMQFLRITLAMKPYKVKFKPQSIFYAHI